MFKKGLVTLVCLTVMSALWSWAATTYSISTKINSLGTKAVTVNGVVSYVPVIGGTIKVRDNAAQNLGIKYTNFTTSAPVAVVVTPEAGYKLSALTKNGQTVAVPTNQTAAFPVSFVKPAPIATQTLVATFAVAGNTDVVAKTWQLQLSNQNRGGSIAAVRGADTTNVTLVGKAYVKNYIDTTPVTVTVTADAGYRIDYLIVDGIKTAYTSASQVVAINPAAGSRVKTVMAAYKKLAIPVTTNATPLVANGISPVNPVADVYGNVRLVVAPTGSNNIIQSLSVTKDLDGSAVAYTVTDRFGDAQTLPFRGSIKVTITGVTSAITVTPVYVKDNTLEMQNCTSTCHLNASAATQAVVPAWNASVHKANAIDCTTCHQTMPGPIVKASVDKNTFKVTNASAGTVGSNYCSSCHTDSTSAIHIASHTVSSTNCTACHESSHNPKVAKADDYVGSATCGVCHATKYDTFVKSGHNFKINKVVDNGIPVFPFSNISGALENMPATTTVNTLGKPTSYSQVSYVVGGYAWKARWIDKNGYIVSSTTQGVQYNLAYPATNQVLGQGWSTYGGVQKKYTCGECHTTGWKYYGGTDLTQKQDGLSGMPGTWVEAGVQCESCHGAGKAHALTPATSNIVKVAAGRTQAELAVATGYGKAVTCGECHTRDGERNPYGGEGAATDGTNRSAYNVASGTTDTVGGRIRASALNNPIGGHHQTGDEMFGVDPDNLAAGPMGKHLKAGVSCGTCHDPHRTTFYQNRLGNGAGVDVACTSCHEVTFTATGAAHTNADCITCHMPKLAKSAVSTGPNAAGKTLGDIKTHVFKIDLAATTNVAAADGGKFLKPFITADYSCGACHATPATKVANLNTNHGGKIHGAIRFKHSTATAGLKPVGASCLGCHTGGTVAVPTKVDSYVGSAVCGTCHSDKYATFVNSGHPYKLTKVVNNTQPVYPFSNIDGRLQEVADVTGAGDLNGNLTDNIGGFPRESYLDATYADVSYVIGGFGWKARWIDNSGYVITGSKTQVNLNKSYWGADSPQWSAYNNNTVTKYDINCTYCHVTGARNGTAAGETGATYPTDLSPGMPGFNGDSFAYAGVQCEACHGAGAAHVKTGAAIAKNPAPRPIADLIADNGYGDAMSCGECHTRDNERLAKYGFKSYFEKYRTDAEIAKFNSDFGGTAMTGLIISNSHGRTSHHEVNEELQGIDPTNVMAGPQGMHKNLKCTDCHDPHKTLVYSGVTGDYPIKECTTCHNGTAATAVTFLQSAHAALSCKDCHMPRLVQNAVPATINGWTFGDNRSHTLKIDLTKSAAVAGQQNTQVVDKDGVSRWYAFPIITREYACRTCHTAQDLVDKAVDWNTFQVH